MKYSEEIMDKIYRRKICKNCGRPFWVKKRINKCKQPSYLRRKCSVTCSNKCSKEFFSKNDIN